MSEPIKPGDLVVVLRVSPSASGCGCTYAEDIGKVFRVRRVYCCDAECFKCGALIPPLWMAEERLDERGLPVTYPFSRLKRIPPLEELEGENRKEELTA